jgi:hypothetical protein
LFRANSTQILSYGIDHGATHARKAVEEAELAIETLEDKDGQVAKLLALAKRTLVLIESQDAIMKEGDHELSDIAEDEEEDESQAKEVKEVEVKETPPEIRGQRQGKLINHPVAFDNNKFGIASWDFQALKARKISDP